MAQYSALPNLLNDSTSSEESVYTDDIPLESIPLYYIASYLMTISYPVIILLGTFGNVMTIVIMQKTKSDESIVNIYFTGMAVMDLVALFSMCLQKWVDMIFHTLLQDVNGPLCKMIVWLSAGSGTISCWYLVCLTLHRAMSVVWPHRVSVTCTRPSVLRVVLGITLFFAAFYAHYLYGVNVISTDNGKTHKCLMESDAYIQFVFDVFVYVEVAIYSVIPFVFLVIGNSILVWKLLVSVKDARQKLSHGNTEQIVTREKTVSSVTLTVIVLSVTFIVLTLPISIEYILSFLAREYNQVTGYEYAKVYMFYAVSRLLAYTNNAVNFYLYCLTGRKFREEFFRLICCKRT